MKYSALLTLFLCAQWISAQVIPSDSMALVAFYNALDGPNWVVQENWLNGPVGTWEGIAVADGRVRDITLVNNELSGDLPDEFYTLTGLRDFNLLNNNITGPLKDEIVNLTECTGLGFQGCKLSGTFPNAVGKMTQLTSLSFSSNNFSGPLPDSVGNLKNVSIIYFSGNQFEGPVPEAWKGLTNLSTISLGANMLTGSLEVFGRMPRMRHLRLSENNWDPQPFPAFLDTLEELLTFECYDCNLTGDIPPMNFSDQADVSSITVGSNNLSGNLLYLMRNNPGFGKYYLDVSNNNFSGTFRLPGLHQIQRISIDDNAFSDIGELEFDDLDQILMRNNKFEFDDLLKIKDLIDSDTINILMSPQDSIGEMMVIEAEDGDTVTLHAGTETPGNTYQWFFGNTDLGISDSPELVLENVSFFNSGIYTCTVRNDGFQFMTLNRRPIQLVIDKSSSIRQMNNAPALNIYPNPADSYIEIFIPREGEFKRWRMISSTGATSMTGMISAGESSLRINLSSVQPGVYSVVFEGRDDVRIGRVVVAL